MTLSGARHAIKHPKHTFVTIPIEIVKNGIVPGVKGLAKGIGAGVGAAAKGVGAAAKGVGAAAKGVRWIANTLDPRKGPKMPTGPSLDDAVDIAKN